MKKFLLFFVWFMLEFAHMFRDVWNYMMKDYNAWYNNRKLRVK